MQVFRRNGSWKRADDRLITGRKWLARSLRVLHHGNKHRHGEQPENQTDDRSGSSATKEPAEAEQNADEPEKGRRAAQDQEDCADVTQPALFVSHAGAQSYVDHEHTGENAREQARLAEGVRGGRICRRGGHEATLQGGIDGSRVGLLLLDCFHFRTDGLHGVGIFGRGCRLEC